MKRLEHALKDYLRVRRSLGFLLREPETALRKFVAFLQAHRASYITTALAVRWATQPTQVQPATWAFRLSMVRHFAIWLSAFEPRTEIPPTGLLPYRYRRTPPYIYGDQEITRLLRRTQHLPSYRGLRARTFTTLFGLLVATGMRGNEALGLDRHDVDLDRGILYIRRAKFGKSRYVPVHSSTVEALKRYATARDRLFPVLITPAFFVSERGTRVPDWVARYTFAKVSQQVGLRPLANGHGRGPRLHDMRHRFAVRTLVRWYRAGLDVERELPKLATYLGHVHVNDTYWYLEAVPELLQLATQRMMQQEVRS